MTYTNLFTLKHDIPKTCFLCGKGEMIDGICHTKMIAWYKYRWVYNVLYTLKRLKLFGLCDYTEGDK